MVIGSEAIGDVGVGVTVMAGVDVGIGVSVKPGVGVGVPVKAGVDVGVGVPVKPGVDVGVGATVRLGADVDIDRFESLTRTEHPYFLPRYLAQIVHVPFFFALITPFFTIAIFLLLLDHFTFLAFAPFNRIV